MGEIRILLSAGRYNPRARWATRPAAGLPGRRCFFTLIGRESLVRANRHHNEPDDVPEPGRWKYPKPLPRPMWVWAATSGP